MARKRIPGRTSSRSVPRKGKLASRSAALRMSITRCAAWSRASSVVSPKARELSNRCSKSRSKSRSPSAENSIANRMRPTFLCNHPGQPTVHPFGRQERARTPIAENLSQRGPLQGFIFHLLPKKLDALLHDGADAGKAPRIDERLGEGMLIVGQRNRGLYCHGPSAQSDTRQR